MHAEINDAVASGGAGAGMTPKEIDHADVELVLDGVRLLAPARARLYQGGAFHKLKLCVYGLLFGWKYPGNEPLKRLKGESAILFVQDRHLKSFSGRRVVEAMRELRPGGSRISLVVLTDWFSILHSFQVLFLLPAFIRLFWRKLRLLNVVDRFVCILLAAKYKLDYEKMAVVFKGLEPGPTVITYCDALSLENLVTQFFGARGFLTVTNQHGLYVADDSDKAGPNREGIRNFCSDKILCWGRATQAEFLKAGVDECRILLFGQTLPHRVRSEWVEAAGKCKPAFGTFGVALSGPNDFAFNLDLLTFAHKLSLSIGWDFLVRVHPADNMDNYSMKVQHLTLKAASNSYFSEVGFTLMGPTGLVMECLKRRHPFLFFDNGALPAPFALSKRVIKETGAWNLSSIFECDFEGLSDLYDSNVDQNRELTALMESQRYDRKC